MLENFEYTEDTNILPDNYFLHFSYPYIKVYLNKNWCNICYRNKKAVRNEYFKIKGIKPAKNKTFVDLLKELHPNGWKIIEQHENKFYAYFM